MRNAAILAPPAGARNFPRRPSPAEAEAAARSIRYSLRMSARETFFAPCAPGFERVLLAEVRDLSLGRPEAQPGGVQFSGTMEDAWRANLHLRTASRVLLLLDRFEAPDADALYAGVSKLPLDRFLRPDGTFAIQARSKNSALSHDHFVEQRTKDAVADAFRKRHGTRPSVDLGSPDLRIHVRILRDRATVSADTSGDPLFKRGWRRYSGRASLKETLAASVILASGWNRRAPLLDPFCGSGTLLVEAALLAANAPPGIFREAFAFARWPGHDAAAFRKMREAARAGIRFPGKLTLAGVDSDPKAVAGAQENLAAAGFGDDVRIDRGDFASLETKRGWNALVATNPPYGERVGEERRLVPVYERLGAMLRERAEGYSFAILTGNRVLADRLGLPVQSRIPTKNGPIDCELLLGRVNRQD